MGSIILIGFMGAGKTTVGKALAQQLFLPFLDTDSYLENKAGMTITRIFETKGEAGFRQLETRILQELVDQRKEQIISCGGGLPLREENRFLLKQMGTVVYLEVSPETVEKRLHGDTTRPLLQGADAKEKIKKLLSERRALYGQAADITVCADEKPPLSICEEILLKHSAAGN